MTVTMTQYFLFHYIYMSVQVNLEQVTKLANGIMNWYILTYKVSNVGSTTHWTKSVCPLMATTKILEKVYIQIFYTVLKITCVIVCNSQPQWVCTEQHYIYMPKEVVTVEPFPRQHCAGGNYEGEGRNYIYPGHGHEYHKLSIII